MRTTGAQAFSAPLLSSGVQPAADPTARRVLVVEDNSDTAQLLEAALVRDGHRVAVAHTAEQALALLGSFAPEVVLCDLGLPGDLDGYAVAAAVRTSGACVHLVALTGHSAAEDRRRTRAAGFHQHHAKPVSRAPLDRIFAEAGTRS